MPDNTHKDARVELLLRTGAETAVPDWTATYGDLACELGITNSGTLVTRRGAVSGAQKVAWAIAATPTPIVVPCHRVIAADGSLTGYLGGLQRKQALLDFEAARGAPDTLRHRDSQQPALL